MKILKGININRYFLILMEVYLRILMEQFIL